MPANPRHPRHLTALALVPILTLPGCILHDIHDQVQATNLSIQQTNQNLAEVTAELRHTNDIVERRLALLEQTNDHLGATRERLHILESIDASLKALDRHLASLRETLDNVDAFIPFLNLADSPDDPPSTQPAAPQPTPPADPTPTPTPPATPPG